jgi:hypothetical protein
MILRKIGGESDIVLEELEKNFKDKYVYSFNSFMSGEDWAIELYRKSLELEKDIMSVETPLIGRNEFKYSSERGTPELYYRIGLNYVSSFFNHNYFIPEEASPDRLNDIFRKTSTVMKPWRKDGGHIIYAMQIPEDTSLLGLDVFSAAQYDLTMLRKITNRPIFVSLHPGCSRRPKVMERNKRYLDSFYKIVEITGSKIVDVSTDSLYDGAWCTVCYTSGTGYDSIMAGIPVITLSERSFVRPITSSTWYDVVSPKMPDRLPWLSRIAYCQWTLAEVKNGTFKKHVEDFLKNK